MSVLDGFINIAVLLLKVFRYLLGLLIVIGLLLLLLFGLLRLLLLFLGTLLLNGVLKSELDRYLIELLEVARHGDFNDRWIILQIEQKLVQVHIHGGGAGVKEN